MVRDPNGGVLIHAGAGVPLELDDLRCVPRRGAPPLPWTVSLRLAVGETLAVLGRNGTGKTTLLRTLAGFVRPAAGTASIPAARSGGVAAVEAVWERQGIPSHLRGTAGLRRAAAIGRIDLRRAEAYAHELGLADDALARRVATYSRGMRQRLAVARSLAALADLVVMDEPFASLDPPETDNLVAVLERHRRAGVHATIVATHDLSNVADYADRLLVLRRDGSTTALHIRKPLVRIDLEGGLEPERGDLSSSAATGDLLPRRVGDSDRWTVLVAAPDAAEAVGRLRARHPACTVQAAPMAGWAEVSAHLRATM